MGVVAEEEGCLSKERFGAVEALSQKELHGQMWKAGQVLLG